MSDKFVKDKAHNKYPAYCCEDIDKLLEKIQAYYTELSNKFTELDGKFFTLNTGLASGEIWVHRANQATEALVLIPQLKANSANTMSIEETGIYDVEFRGVTDEDTIKHLIIGIPNLGASTTSALSISDDGDYFYRICYDSATGKILLEYAHHDSISTGWNRADETTRYYDILGIRKLASI